MTVLLLFLQQKANLQCGQTYHIKLAVGNIADDLLDSAVFLKGFRIKPMELSVSGGLFGNTITLCNGLGATINSGITPGGNTLNGIKTEACFLRKRLQIWQCPQAGFIL